MKKARRQKPEISHIKLFANAFNEAIVKPKEILCGGKYYEQYKKVIK